MIRLITELIKGNPKFALNLLSTKVYSTLLFTNPRDPAAFKDVTVDLATLLTTSILPLVPTFVADNFLESLCSYHQASFLVKSKDAIVTSDWYFASELGTLIFDSLNQSLQAFTGLSDSSTIAQLEAYALMLQSIFKNIEYRTKEQTGYLSKKINELLDTIFSVWEKIATVYDKQKANKIFLKLVHNIYTIVQDSSLLAVQRFFFGEDYSKFLHQYSEDLETMSKQVFSSNIDFCHFIEGKHISSPRSVSSEGKIRTPLINQNILLITNTAKKPTVNLPNLFEQNLGEDLQHIKMCSRQQEFTEELNAVLNFGKDGNLYTDTTNKKSDNIK